MDKMFTYLMVLSGISLMLGLIGVMTTAGVVMNAFGLSTTGINYDSSAMAGIIVALGAFTIATIALGFVTKVAFESMIFIKLGMVGLLASFVVDFINIINYGFSFGLLSGTIGILLLGPLYIGFVYSIIQAWRGQD